MKITNQSERRLLKMIKVVNYMQGSLLNRRRCDELGIRCMISPKIELLAPTTFKTPIATFTASEFHKCVEFLSGN